MTCSNCEKWNDPSKIGGGAGWLHVVSDGITVAELCKTCQENVLALKLVLRRNKPDEQFSYEQYLPIEVAK